MKKIQIQARRKGRTDEEGWFDAFDFKVSLSDAEKWLSRLAGNTTFDYRAVKTMGACRETKI